MRAELFPFQKWTVDQLLAGKHIVISSCGSGKTAMLFNWLYQLKPNKVLVVTTASKANSQDMFTEADKFNGEDWLDTLEEYDVVSWNMLYKWKDAHAGEDLSEWVVVYDELQRASAGVSSKMGRAFLYIAKHCKAWTGYTGTPGDTWIKFYPYFEATEKVKNKSYFLRNFCVVTTYKGYPEIDHYLDEKTLKDWWAEISVAPDTSRIERELPKQNHQVVTFKKPYKYNQVLKTSERLEPNENGDTFIASNSELAHYLRQMCNTKEKQQWLYDFLQDTNAPVVIFYNYNSEFDSICEMAKKAKRGKIWRINGNYHEIPSADEVEDGDVIVAHYMSGGEGLNLQFCNYMVMYSYNYSYSMSIQARGRIRRVGQEKPQFFYYLMCSGTIEEAVAKALKNKSDFSADTWLASQKESC